MDKHPHPALLARFGRGRLQRRRSREVVRHLLTDCDDCRRVTSHLLPPADASARLRRRALCFHRYAGDALAVEYGSGLRPLLARGRAAADQPGGRALGGLRAAARAAGQPFERQWERVTDAARGTTPGPSAICCWTPPGSGVSRSRAGRSSCRGSASRSRSASTARPMARRASTTSSRAPGRASATRSASARTSGRREELRPRRAAAQERHRRPGGEGAGAPAQGLAARQSAALPRSLPPARPGDVARPPVRRFAPVRQGADHARLPPRARQRPGGRHPPSDGRARRRSIRRPIRAW